LFNFSNFDKSVEGYDALRSLPPIIYRERIKKKRNCSVETSEVKV